jgi:hypothetical protein
MTGGATKGSYFGLTTNEYKFSELPLIGPNIISARASRGVLQGVFYWAWALRQLHAARAAIGGGAFIFFF